MCDKIVVINQGKIVADDTEENLSKNLVNNNKISVKIDGPADEVKKVVSSIAGVKTIDMTSKETDEFCKFSIESEEGIDIRRELFKRVSERSWYIMELKTSDMSLEDIFLRLTVGESISAVKRNGGNE